MEKFRSPEETMNVLETRKNHENELRLKKNCMPVVIRVLDVYVRVDMRG